VPAPSDSSSKKKKSASAMGFMDFLDSGDKDEVLEYLNYEPK